VRRVHMEVGCCRVARLEDVSLGLIGGTQKEYHYEEYLEARVLADSLTYEYWEPRLYRYVPRVVVWKARNHAALGLNGALA
jgi:hypothetical protein